MTAVARLSSEQRGTPVHCHLLHNGEIVLDQSLPWGVVAVDTQAGRHLPAHQQQLRDLT